MIPPRRPPILGPGLVVSVVYVGQLLSRIRVAADRLGILEETQFIYEGRRHCWYRDGWHGPGWYWCGYDWRRGLGWGGPEGWQGWRWREERREERAKNATSGRWDRY